MPVHTSPFVPVGPQQAAPPLPPPVDPNAPPAPPVAPLSDQWLQSPEGKPVKVGGGDVPHLAQLGYTPLDPQRAQQLEAGLQHKGLVSALGAAGQGALETLAPVVGPLIQHETGLYTYEQQRELAEAHPLAHPFGQVIGAVAPAIATLGGSAPVSGAAAGAAGAKAAVGTGLRAAAKASAPEVLSTLGAKVAAGVETSLGSNSLGRITAAAADQAVQAAGYTATNFANRALQGDPKATAEQFFHEAAGSVIFGAGLGALGGAMTKMAGAHTGDFIEGLREMEARGGLKATGAIQGILAKWEKQVGPERLKEIGRYLGREGGVGPFKSYEEMLQLAETRFKGPAAQEMETILQNATTGKPGSVGFIDEVMNKIWHDPMIQRWGKNPLDREAFARFRQDMDNLVDEYVVRNADGTVRHYKQISPETLHTLSKSFAEKARGYAGSMDPSRSAFAEAFDAGRVAVNKRLDQLLEDVSQSQGGLSGEAMKAWKDAKFRYQAGLFLEDGATRGWNRGMGNNQISPMEALGTMTGAITGHAPGAAIMGTAVAVARREGSSLENAAARSTANFLERLQQNSGRKISESVGRIFKAGAGEATALISDAHEQHSVSSKNFSQMAARIARSANDPEHVAQQITTNFGPVVEGDPKVALALQQTASQAAQHLLKQLPTYQQNGPLDASYRPSPSEVAKLNRTLTAVHAPESVLNRIADGTYTAEDGLTLAAVYPSLHPQMKTQVAEALAEALAKGEKVPYRSQLALSQFLGTSLGTHQTGGAIAAVQAAYAAQSAPPQQPKGGSNVEFRSSAHLASETQSREMKGLGKA